MLFRSSLNRNESITIVNITHFMDEAADSDRIFVMDRGEVVLSGTPRQVFLQEEKLVSIGLSVPKAVQMRNRLREKGIPLSDDIIATDELVEALCQLQRTI